MNTLFIIYTFVALVCFFQIIILTCEATRHKRQIEELQDRCEYLSKQIKSLIKIADNSSKIDDINEDRLGNISDTLDLYKRLVDSLNDEQAKLNFRVQQLEMLNSNVTLTDKYDPLNPSKVFYDTNTHVVCDSKPETINFTEE